MINEICLFVAALAATSMPQAMTDIQLDQTPVASGAQIDESSVRHTIQVDPKGGRINTLRQGFQLAFESLVKGVPTRLVISPGVYREQVVDLDWSKGRAADTPLVIEGKGKVVWSGADVFQSGDWKQSGGLWTHAWPFRWGNFGYSWSVKGLIGHRSEMMFVDGQPLMPRILEQYAIEGIVQNPEQVGIVKYRFLGERDPQVVLAPGEFGVTEQGASGPQIHMRPLPGQKLRNDSIEVATRGNLLDLRGKNQVVLRNITFTQIANDDRDYGANNAIRFSIDPARLSHDVLIDKCKILWSAHNGLHVDGNRWTIRDSEFSFNGGSGIASDQCHDLLMERNRTNFNVWRLWRGGELGYYSGGFKLQRTVLNTIRGHESIGNCTMGAWWDIHCRDVRVSELVAIGNAANLQFELCEGPLVADRLLVAGGRAGDGQLRLWEHGATKLTHSIVYSDYVGVGNTGLYNLRWFGRTDPHSMESKITAGTNLSEHNLFVAGPHVPNYGMIDDIRGPEWSAREPLTYRGIDNVFWSPVDTDLLEKWIKDDDRKGELAARAMPVATWMSSKSYSEDGARRLDPEFLDPARYDFRFGKTSPLFTERSQFLQFALSPADREKWAWFCGWCGYHPESWNTPPPE